MCSNLSNFVDFPSFSEVQHQQTFPAGDTAYIECNADPGDPPQQMLWFRDNVIIPNSDSARFHQVLQTLVIDSITEADVGVYVCAFNTSSSSSIDITVILLLNPGWGVKTNIQINFMMLILLLLLLLPIIIVSAVITKNIWRRRRMMNNPVYEEIGPVYEEISSNEQNTNCNGHSSCPLEIGKMSEEEAMETRPRDEGEIHHHYDSLDTLRISDSPTDLPAESATSGLEQCQQLVTIFEPNPAHGEQEESFVSDNLTSADLMCRNSQAMDDSNIQEVGNVLYNVSHTYSSFKELFPSKLLHRELVLKKDAALALEAKPGGGEIINQPKFQ